MSKYICLICGRKFPQGQGIIIKYGRLELAFHSNRCASKFLRLLLERIPPEEAEGYVKRLRDELIEAIKEKMKLKQKRI